MATGDPYWPVVMYLVHLLTEVDQHPHPQYCVGWKLRISMQAEVQSLRRLLCITDVKNIQFFYFSL
jgi:hypothetical protein